MVRKRCSRARRFTGSAVLLGLVAHAAKRRVRIRRPTDVDGKPVAAERRSTPSRLLRLVLVLSPVALLLVVGWLLKPSLESTPKPPRPWGLWLSTDTETGSDHEPDWLLALKIEAQRGCSGTATVSGALQWRLKELSKEYSVKPPAQLLFAVAGAPISRLELSDPESVDRPDGRTWHKVGVDHGKDMYLAHAPVANWTIPDQALKFRFSLKAAGSAGYASCFVTSPTVISAPSNEGIVEGEQEPWGEVEDYMPLYIESHRLDDNLNENPGFDVVTQISVPTEEPDRASLDAGAHVQRQTALLTCNTREPPFNRETEDRYYNNVRRLGERFCASIQTFRKHDVASKLNVRTNVSSTLIGVVIAYFGALVGIVLNGSFRRR